jgi:ADP-ribose pyrophosphatase
MPCCGARVAAAGARRVGLRPGDVQIASAGIPMTASSRSRRSPPASAASTARPARGARAVFRVTDAATVLPYDPVRDRILLVEQVRFGPLAQGDPSPWLLEPVAGLIDAGETPRTRPGARRRRRRGSPSAICISWRAITPAPAACRRCCFLRRHRRSARRGGGARRSCEEDEDILGHVIGFDRAME